MATTNPEYFQTYDLQVSELLSLPLSHHSGSIPPAPVQGYTRLCFQMLSISANFKTQQHPTPSRKFSRQLPKSFVKLINHEEGFFTWGANIPDQEQVSTRDTEPVQPAPLLRKAPTRDLGQSIGFPFVPRWTSVCRSCSPASGISVSVLTEN